MMMMMYLCVCSIVLDHAWQLAVDTCSDHCFSSLTIAAVL